MISAWLQSLSFLQVVALIFTVYFTGVLVWIKGTDPLSSTAWEIAWVILKCVLTLGVGLLILVVLAGCGKEESR